MQVTERGATRHWMCACLWLRGGFKPAAALDVFMRVAVIGGGPSGLVTLKYLLTAHQFLGVEPIEAHLFESDDAVGGTFYARTYEDAELVSSTQLTTFSDFRASKTDGDFMSAKRYVQYLNDYCTHFNLWPNIHLNTRVDSVTRMLKGKHVVTYTVKITGETSEWECDAIAVCSGLHVTPHIPDIPGIEHVPVKMHSSQFKEKKQFGVDKTVMILGSGETGSDLSWMAVISQTKRVVMCHRSGFHFAPKRNLSPILFPILGRKSSGELTVPLDNARASLFDTAYVHPLLRNHTALWTFYNIYVRTFLWLNTGTPEGLDQVVGEPDPQKNHVSRIFFNKSSNAAPYISYPYKHLQPSPTPPTLLSRIRSALIGSTLKDTGGRYIDLAPWPQSISPQGIVTFQNNHRPEWERMRQQTIKPDIVIFCTGYNQEYPFFTAHNASLCNKSGKAAKRYVVEHTERNVRGIWNRDDPSVGFIGFLRPSLGAIPPLAEMQAQLWIVQLVAPHWIPRPLDSKDEEHYRLRHPAESRVKYGVDHESYVYQLGLDMDSAMGVMEVLRRGLWERGVGALWKGEGDGTWKKTKKKKKKKKKNGWKLPLVWGLGANYNVKFRMKGPWRWEGAEEVMETELWRMIKRRRWFWEHFCLSLLPMMIFGPVSLLVGERGMGLGSKKEMVNGVEGRWMREKMPLEAEL
ncbi:FAD/NAD(P)-binding domain-containing protein [Neurospora hispaniola]|uniref:FAD/NAD(P)-binding domain-containing protein n=1 Tax=Neurospora hispaniola TaxID=588809 RepID=A0AAJ0I943_9PEZI|nr:FAD/NAD(P)-binding domain-containing protein [Neurospora hispaniola]